MFELIQSRKADEGNRQYDIIRAGTAAAHSKKPPKKIFYKNTPDGKGVNYVNFAERRKQLLEEQKKKQVKLNWGEPPTDKEV